MGALGHRRHGGHKNKAGMGDLWSCRSGFGRYGRGNFPGHDVWLCLAKMIKNGCRWVKMDADGYNRVYSNGGHKKKDKNN